MRWNVQANQSEGEQSLVYPTNHNTNILIPVVNITHVCQSATHVPGQKAPAQCPEESEEAIDIQVQPRVQAREAMEDDGEGKGSDGDEGGCGELQDD